MVKVKNSISELWVVINVSAKNKRRVNIYYSYSFILISVILKFLFKIPLLLTSSWRSRSSTASCSRLTIYLSGLNASERLFLTYQMIKYSYLEDWYQLFSNNYAERYRLFILEYSICSFYYYYFSIVLENTFSILSLIWFKYSFVFKSQLR